MATDITPEDLVKLAVYCRHEVVSQAYAETIIGEDRQTQVWIRVSGAIVLWQPHLPEGAVQRDELEDAVIASGRKWQHHSCKDGYFRSTIKQVALKCWRWELQATAKEKTRGAAVCRAALQVIGGTNGKEETKEEDQQPKQG